MKKLNSAEYAALLASGLEISEMPFGKRSDLWWDKFWSAIGIEEVKRIKESV